MEKGISANLEDDSLRDMRERDARDAQRTVAPPGARRGRPGIGFVKNDGPGNGAGHTRSLERLRGRCVRAAGTVGKARGFSGVPPGISLQIALFLTVLFHSACGQPALACIYNQAIRPMDFNSMSSNPSTAVHDAMGRKALPTCLPRASKTRT